MAMHLSSFTEKMDALRDKGFSDEEINAILNAPVSPQQREQQPSSVDSIGSVDTSNVMQLLKSIPSPLPVTDTMTDSNRAYAKEWNRRIDALSFFAGWKADVIGFGMLLFIAFPFILCFFSDGTLQERQSSFFFAMGWGVTCMLIAIAIGVYIKEKFILPHVKFFFKKQIN